MSNRLKNTSSPPKSLDALADFLQHTHHGVRYKRGTYTGSWTMPFEVSQDFGFHIITQGHVLLTVDEQPPLTLHTRDIVLLRTKHTLSSNPALHTAPEANIQMICGAYLVEDAQNHPVLSSFPPMIVLRAGERSLSIDRLIALLDDELREEKIGAHTVVTHLIDTLFIHILRSWIESNCPHADTWVHALADPMLARALSLIHTRYEHPWTLDTLARASNTSRSTLSREFLKQVGSSPIQFLTKYRLHIAERLVQQCSMNLDEIASHVGYSSGFALSKAFKRNYGQSPTHYTDKSLPKNKHLASP